MLDDVLADRVQEVRLAKPNATVEKQRVVGLARSLGNGHRSGVRKRVVVAHDERVERVLRVEGKLLPRGVAVRAKRLVLLRDLIGSGRFGSRCRSTRG